MDFLEAVFDLLQRARLDMHAVTRAPQLGIRLNQLRQRRIDQIDGGFQTAIDVCELPQLGSVSPQTADQRIIAFVKQLLALEAALVEFLGMRENIFPCLKLLFLAGPQTS